MRASVMIREATWMKVPASDFRVAAAFEEQPIRSCRKFSVANLLLRLWHWSDRRHLHILQRDSGCWYADTKPSFCSVLSGSHAVGIDVGDKFDFKGSGFLPVRKHRYFMITSGHIIRRGPRSVRGTAGMIVAFQGLADRHPTLCDGAVALRRGLGGKARPDDGSPYPPQTLVSWGNNLWSLSSAFLGVCVL
jgi:hypothetical protein